MNFIYIISLPRSGSTLLQRLINSNEKTFTLPETWYLLSQNIFLANREGSLESGFYINKNALGSFCENIGINCQTLFNTSVEKYRQLIFDNPLGQASYFIEKTPRNILLLDNIYESLEDNDRMILLKRNPKDVFKSYLNYFDHFPYLKAYKFFKEINHYITILENFGNKPNVLIITYEDLIKNPDEVTLKLQKYLGLNLNNYLSNVCNQKSKTFHGDVSGLHQIKVTNPKKKKGVLMNLLANFFFGRTSPSLRILIFPLIIPTYLVYSFNPRIIKLLLKRNTFTH